MLTAIHEKTQGWITGIILGLLTIPFALWGVSSYFEYTGTTNVATVDGKDISVAVYRSALERQQAILEQAMGREFDPRVIESTKFKEQVLNSLIDRMLLDRAAASQGYRISNTDLAEYIRHASQFRSGGRFDPRLYSRFVENSGYGVQQFEARVREERIRQQMESGLVAGTIITDGDLANLVRLMGEKRVASYAVLKPQRFMAQATVTPAQIKAYYAAHLGRYKTPEEVRVQYVELSAANLAKTLKPTEQQLRQSYENNIARYTTPEQRRASHILIALPPNASPQAARKALAEAQSIRTRLLHGANFGKLAREYSADTVSAAKGGDLGFVTPGSLEKSFVTALFSLKKPGDISEPVRTSFGYHIIELTAIRPAETVPFAKARARVAADWRERHAIDQYYSESERFRNLIFEQSDSLAPAAKAFGLTVEESGWFSRSGGAGIAANPKVVAAAFDPDVLSQGHNSHGIRLGSHMLLAIRDVGHRPASIRPLVAVSDQIRQSLLMKAALVRARQEEAKALQSLNQGASLAAVANRDGLQVIGPVTVTRSTAGDLPPALVEALFGAGKPAGTRPVYGGADLGDGGYAVFAVSKVEPGSMATATKALKDRAAGMLAQRRGSDYIADYLNGLRQKAKIKIYRKRL
ncbi:MAG: SurA N-terminal domain-containing protein [Gammaproteobacteria bacterium]|nr:SurA N-terminal domain-containing protein [Gammaproteobacteria bacterium]